MKYGYNYIFILIIITSLFLLSQSITFTSDEQTIELKNSKEFIITANYNLQANYKYLYIYPKNITLSKTIIKMYFQQNSPKNSDQNSKINYLYSDYSTIDFNSGLFIEIEDLSYDSATIFIIAYETCNVILQYNYANDIIFPPYAQYINFQFNQFILKKGQGQTIVFIKTERDNEYLLIFSKTSLRNFEVKVKVSTEDVTEENLAYLYPNGCSILLDRTKLKDNFIYVTINNKDIQNQILLLGYMHHKKNELFPTPLTNGYQLYLEGNRQKLEGLLNSGNQNFEQYFTYQIFSKNIKIEFYNSDKKENEKTLSENEIEYNSMFHYNINFPGHINFFFGPPVRNAINIQYLDYSDNNLAQKSLQPLVTGVPKSMIIPGGKSMYHFLPIERDYSNLYYYLRAKNQEKIYISFEICTSYPEDCNFEGKQKESVEVINNIGLWHTLKANRKVLQLIYIYCEKECAYDIIMTYDEDPFFLFPENNYTKYIGDKGNDIFALPVFEYFNTSETESLYIDLIVLSGKANFILKDGKDGDNLENSEYSVAKVGNKLTYRISSDKFLNNKKYYKKEIYAVVQSDNYKNTFYNIMYATGTKNSKILSNNIINTELLTVGNEADETNTFIFENKGTNLYVSISSSYCKFKVNTDNNNYYKYSQTITKAGSYSFKIILQEDSICIESFKEKILLFAYSDTTKVLISENTLVNAKINKNVSFVHLFKPDDDNDIDNSFTIEIDRLSPNSLDFNYKLEKMPIKENEEKSSASFNQKIINKKNKYISNKQIKEICGNEFCSLTINLGISTTSIISLYLNKNGVNYARKIDSTFIGTTNSKSPLFFYIDLNTEYDSEILINSYGQDLKYAYEKKKENEDNILPLKGPYSNAQNNHKILINKGCGDSCRLYIGVYAVEDNNENEAETTFSISYLFKESESSSSTISLPLNYFTQYTFTDLTKIKYSINTLEEANVILELDIIKQNENDISEVKALINNKDELSPSQGRKSLKLTGEAIIEITNTNPNNEATFKFRASTVGKTVDVVPLLSSYPEKCNTPPCYYLLNDFSPDNEQSSAFLYVPETEDASVTIKELDYSKEIDIKGDFVSNTIKKNWYEHEIKDRNQKILIKVDNGKNLTLCSSFYNKPNIVTLNYGEKRAFTISKKSIDNILFKIKKPTTNNYKLRINIHSIKGNGIFKILNEAYPIGLDSAYKEDISIVIDNILTDLEIKASNENNNEEGIYNDFSFSIYYIIDITSQLYYPIKSDSINSFKFNNKEKLTNLFFYMEVNKDNELNMNIKIYSDSSTYAIKSYIVDEDFINKKSVSPSNEIGEIHNFIKGGSSTTGNLAFSKLEISKEALTQNIKDTKKYLFIKISQNDQNNNKVNIDLYPYGINNTMPLARNEFFIENLLPNTDDHPLLLVKSEFDYKVNSKIDFVPPSSKKYKKGVGKSNIKQKDKIRNEEDIISNNTELGKEVIILESENDNKNPYILFNIFSEDNNKESDYDLFLLRYRNQANDNKLYYTNKDYFNVYGTANNVTFQVNGLSPKYSTGKNILILSAYTKSKVEKLTNDDKYKPLYLFFNKKIEPDYIHYEVLQFDMGQASLKSHYETIINGGEYYFTAISVIEDNGREEYISYEGKYYKLESSDLIGGLLDYMRNHIFATILIFIIILFFIGAMVNICRAERRGRRDTSLRETEAPKGRLMEDKEE